ncbi:hypothetical protein DM01DRAFT_1335922 [Hesseltinella vesiculosa]|uniref:BHLH domain-containing protein n=1 Tax=Hesseltinella vesiculosa TaxID=101127 RepID=A0A1X2GHP8_9FUNG|nr:hypothetical protein DM01DRAFT_1335922 [Hesseltinella vesiculosa]
MAMKELMDVIPGNEKNKSRVIARAVDYIQTLNHEKGSLRKDLDHYQALCVQYEREIADLKNGREPVTPRPSSTTS